MAGVTNSISDWKDAYDGFSIQRVGIGLSDPNIYASESYAQMKTQVLLLGDITDITYSGWEHDPQPKILSIAYEPQYNTIISYQLNYCMPQMRQALVKFVVNANVSRMHQNLPIIVPYQLVKAAMPWTENIVRRYKVTGIRVIGNVPVKDWPKAIKGANKWQTMFKGLSNIK